MRGKIPRGLIINTIMHLTIPMDLD